MKVYFMRRDALEILKGSLDSTYSKYYTESNSKWLWDICNGNPFCEFKEIPDFNLEALNSGLSKGEIEFNNCKILYRNLSFLSESQASDERLWAGLCHTVYYEYMRKRWGYDIENPKNAKEAVSSIKSRFFFSGGTRSGLYRNSMAKCWWVGRNTFDKTQINPFAWLDIIGNSDISTKISDIFYSNTFASNPSILGGIIKGMKYFNDEGIQLVTKDHIRPTLQLLNAIGGTVILDCLDSDEIADIFIDNVQSIIQGDKQGMEYEDTDNLEDDSSEIGTDLLSDNADEAYVSLGQNVVVRNNNTGDEKTYKVDYLNSTKEIPGLARELLGKSIGCEFTYNNASYKILRATIR